MYLWNVDSLVQDLKNNNVDQKEQFKYTLAFSVLALVASDPLFNIGLKYTLMDSAASVFLLIVTILGVTYCFKVNQKADGKDFLLRFFTLGLPIAIRFAAIIIPISILVGFFEALLSDNNYDASDYSVTSLYQVIISTIAQVLFYMYFASRFSLFSK